MEIWAEKYNSESRLRTADELLDRLPTSEASHTRYGSSLAVQESNHEYTGKCRQFTYNKMTTVPSDLDMIL